MAFDFAGWRETGNGRAGPIAQIFLDLFII
jgi:hypothetical protein